MRLTQPRIAPIEEGEMEQAHKDALKDFGTGPIFNIFRTLARAPKALTRFNFWGGYVLSKRNDLPEREREILILRVGYLCRSGYEFAQHTRIGLASGLSQNDIERIKQGADAGWDAPEKALICAADELVNDHFVSDQTWAALRHSFTEKQCMDVVFTCGQYTQVSMMLNSFGVQLDEGLTLDPDLKGY